MRKHAAKVTLFDGELTVWMLTNSPGIRRIIYTDILRSIAERGLYEMESNYVDLVSCLVDVEFKAKSGNDEIKRFAEWFEIKTGKPVIDMSVFMQMVSYEFLETLHQEAYEPTRVKLPQSPEITQGERPSEDSPLEPSTTE